MSAFEPGQVAVATVRGVPNVRVMRTDGTFGADISWISAEITRGARLHGDENVTDVRQLVVLDLDPSPVANEFGVERTEAQSLVDMLRETADEFFVPDAAKLARKVADQIEAQTKPPRIPEPGLWGVVKDRDHRYYVRESRNGSGWNRIGSDCNVTWYHIVDPVLVREGVEP